MAFIKPDVESGHLLEFPLERSILTPFLNGFDITWAKRRRAYNTELSVYFLLPERFIQEQFGLDSEVMLVVSDYPTVQPRTMQAIESMLSDEPARGRVDQAFFFIVTKDTDALRWVEEYTGRNPQSRIPVVFVWSSLEAKRADQWFVRNTISNQLFSRDLFDYQLPLDSDLFFFGRDAVVAEFADAIKRSQNRGIFGLRKTGKTSVLFKVKRIAERENNLVLYYDCKNPAIRNQRWEALLERVSEDILKTAGKAPLKRPSGVHISDHFNKVIKRVPRARQICLIFDEIEYISPIAKLDPHWREEFVPFWQTMWTAQSEIRRLSFIISGVNPTVVEIDSVQGVQNPMFGIVRPTYLRGFEENELRPMIHYFGKRMGMHFSLDGLAYIYDRYGGHPLLTRMACSHVNGELTAQSAVRPVVLDKARLLGGQDEREEEIAFYSRHVVSELREFYPVEYELLETLASGNIAEFSEFATEPDFTKHLRDYGLVDMSAKARPRFKIPVIAKFVANELARRNGAKFRRYIISPEKRAGWLSNRLKTITQDLRFLERVAKQNNLHRLYGDHSFPEAERFAEQKPVVHHDEFESFINVCNRCLVEPLINYGNKIGDKQYYWKGIRKMYPDLWDGLERIRVYRHENLHVELSDATATEVDSYLARDLDGKRIAQVDDPYFMLQQAVIDELFVGIHSEIDRYS